MTKLSAPECPLGYPHVQLERELSKQDYRRLQLWMNGQTQAICSGTRWNAELQEYEPDACSKHPHGGVVYAWDVTRWLNAGDIID